VYFSDADYADFVDYCTRNKREMSVLASEAALKEVRLGSLPMTLTLREWAPCGEWREADDQPSTLEISGQLASMWRVAPGDEMIHSRGLSMINKGIPEEAFLLMSQVPFGGPKHGDICAVMGFFKDENKSPVGTIKTWEWSGSGVDLKDGEGKKLKVPDGVIRIEARSVWTGHLLT
jgi:hypothetical protein